MLNATKYKPPAEYVAAYQDAPEVNDLRFLHAAGAVVKIGGIPVVALENLNISQTQSKTPIVCLGTLAPLGFDPQPIQVTVQGQIVQMAKMSLAKSTFYPESVGGLLANVNKVFNITVQLQDHSQDDPSKILTGVFLEVENCTNTGSNISLSPNSNIKDSFTAVGTFVKRNWDTLNNFQEAA